MKRRYIDGARTRYEIDRTEVVRGGGEGVKLTARTRVPPPSQGGIGQLERSQKMSDYYNGMIAGHRVIIPRNRNRLCIDGRLVAASREHDDYTYDRRRGVICDVAGAIYITEVGYVRREVAGAMERPFPPREGLQARQR